MYERAVLPPLALGYTPAAIHSESRWVGRDSLEGIPSGIEGTGVQWTDLTGRASLGLSCRRRAPGSTSPTSARARSVRRCPSGPYRLPPNSAQADTLARFDRVAQLVDGFESAFGTELLATVQWVATREHPKDEEALVRAVHDWGPRKRAFTPRQINLTAQRLRDGGWLVDARA